MQERLKQLQSEVDPRVTLWLDHHSLGQTDYVSIEFICVAERLQGQGLATTAMNQTVDWADDYSIVLTLVPAKELGKSNRRLVNFYKRFGFIVDRLDRNAMIRYPVLPINTASQKVPYVDSQDHFQPQ